MANNLKELDQEVINIMESLSIMLTKIQTLYEQSKENEQVNIPEGVATIGLSAESIDRASYIVYGLLHTYRWLVLSNIYPKEDPAPPHEIPSRIKELHKHITKRAMDWLKTIVKENN